MKNLLQKKQRRRYLLFALLVNSMIVLGYGYYWIKVNVPSEIKLLREITGFRELSNHALAHRVPSEEKLLGLE